MLLITLLSIISLIETTFKCSIYYKQYKRKIALDNYIKNINNANNKKLEVYWLSSEAIAKVKTVIVYKIKNKLKQYAKHIGSYKIKVKYTKNKFF